MDRITIDDAARNFTALVNRVDSDGESFELARGDRVIACLSPVRPRSILKLRDLNAFLQGLRTLGNDADAFSDDLRTIRRELPPEVNPY